MEVDSPTLTMHAEVMLDPVCNVPVSGESRETKDWPPATFLVTHRGVSHLVVQGGRPCLHTDTAIQLTSRLLERHQNPW